MHRHADILQLPSDTARWAWLAVLLEAKVQPEPGAFRSEAHLRQAIGWRLARCLPTLFAAGLLEQSEIGSRSGRVEVHNWSRWQSESTPDMTHPARQKAYREREKAKKEVPGTAVPQQSRGTASDGDPSIEGYAAVTPPFEGTAVTLPEKDRVGRRELARIVREAPNEALRHRYRRVFDKTYGHLYQRGVAA
jgi:hypothetical protein